MLRAENAEVVIHPDDRKYGALLVGSQGSGKCVGPDDMVLLGGRLIRAEDAWARYSTSASFDGEGWWTEPLEQPKTCALDDLGRIVTSPVVRLYRQRVTEPLRRVRLSDGSELTMTRRHRLRGADGWTNELDEGTVVCVPQRLDWPGVQTDLELVELLSWQIAEGCETGGGRLGPRGSSSVAITQADTSVLEHLRELVLSIGARYGLNVNHPPIDCSHGVPTLSVRSAEWRDFLVARGYRWGRLSREKAVPDFILQGDREAARVCLRAFADAEGSVLAQQRTVEITTASRVLGEQLRLLLRRFGILASFRLKRACATNGHRISRDYRRLRISGDSLRAFLAEIGFGYEHKQVRLRDMLAGLRRNSNREGIYTQDVLTELKDSGVPFSWISPRSWNYLHCQRAAPAIAQEMAVNLRRVADRLDAGMYVTAGSRGIAGSSARTVTLRQLDTAILRDYAARLERRIRQNVFYLTIERIEEVEYNGWVYDFEVPEHRNYVVGGMLAHNTAALATFYANDAESRDTAPIVIDPKSELSHICLRSTPPDCEKRVWFLDLGRPAFGMNPLRLAGDRPLPVEAGAVAANIVAALLDINENQIFMSSRRYLYHAVIGAIALGHRQQRRAKFEDVYNLLLPTKKDFREAVAEACADQPDLDQTAEFYRYELPHELNLAGSATAQRLDAPRNKISLLLQVPSLRRFFNHPTDIPLREIIEARDILIVDANMGLLGEDNSKACMVFLLRMLHTQMQRQVHLPESERPRVPLLVDEAHYIAGVENVVDQIATHRRAGLEPAFGLQYFAQLGSGSQHEQKIRKGVINLLQSRFLFRMGDAQDAEEATRIAMAVYSTMIRDDPDSRARLRVTPEQALNFPNHYCLASWIANGSRIPSFMGQTYPLPLGGDEWANRHLNAQAKRVAPYPEQLESTLDARAESDSDNGSARGAPAEREYIAVPYEEKDEAKRLGARWDPGTHSWYIPDGVGAEPFARWRSPKGPPPESGEARNGSGDLDSARPETRGVANGVRPSDDRAAGGRRREVKVDYEAPPAPPNLADSPVRRVVGRRIPGPPPDQHDQPAPDSLRELAYLDRINEIGPADQLDGAANLPRLYDEDYAILSLLDRAGLAPRTLIGRAVFPTRTSHATSHRLTKLYRHGLIAQHATGLREHKRTDGKAPLLYSLTRRGLEVAQGRTPAPAISPKREWRAIEQRNAGRLGHDLHALAWAIALHRTVGPIATDHWRTPRYATGRYPVPQTGSARDRHPISLGEIPVPDGQAIIDVELKRFTEVKPDVSLELRVDTLKLTFDLLVELDLTARPSYNREKFLAYDAFLCGWSLAHPRYRALGTRPIVVFVCPDAHAALACAREADATFTGRIGMMGTPAEHWYYPGRDHVLFAVEADIHRADLSALALPPQPPPLREQLSGQRDLGLARAALLPHNLAER
jgi:hypothetical protein